MHFNITEFFPGMGTLCAPFTAGLSQHGVVKVAGAAEVDGRYLKLFSSQHPEASTFLGSVTGYAPEEVSTHDRNAINVFLAGIPCTGAALCGRAKLHLSSAEMHPDVGHLFLPVLHHISRHLPEVCVFENVRQYPTTFSAGVIRSHLRKLGYDIFEKTVNPYEEFAVATERVRWIMVASRIGKFEWNYTPRPFTGTIEHLLDPESDLDDKESFSEGQVKAHDLYCSRKASEGCGFSRRLLERTSTKVPTIPRVYGKIQPTGIFLRTRTSYRMLRPAEVARIHGFGEDFVNVIRQLPKTTAYEVLGQGVVATPFRELGATIGLWAATRVPMAYAV